MEEDTSVIKSEPKRCEAAEAADEKRVAPGRDLK